MIKDKVCLPPIPDKVYFSIGEASQLALVKPHVLRYWEEEFPELQPVTRSGQRRYYQRKDLLFIRKIRELLYDKGFTIAGARKFFKTNKILEPEGPEKPHRAQVARSVSATVHLSKNILTDLIQDL